MINICTKIWYSVPQVFWPIFPGYTDYYFPFTKISKFENTIKDNIKSLCLTITVLVLKKLSDAARNKPNNKFPLFSMVKLQFLHKNTMEIK